MITPRITHPNSLMTSATYCKSMMAVLNVENSVTHHMAVCQIKLSGKDYRSHTLQDALHTKARAEARSAPVTSVTETKTDTTACNQPHSCVIPAGPAEKSISDGSDISISSLHAPPPLKGEHFIWTCQLMSTTDCISLKPKC